MPLSDQDISVIVNGRSHQTRVVSRMLLVDLLRDELRYTGTHVGCEHGVCGACTVLLDGQPVRSCLMFAVQADGASITTVEGLAPSDALQCGFCTPGILLTLAAYLAEHPRPTEAELRQALSGNLCRCTGYQPILAAALDAAAGLGGAGTQ
jgi:carbon-monoxide dehydrogenase small subunit